jgi:hypothetical protein
MFRHEVVAAAHRDIAAGAVVDRTDGNIATGIAGADYQHLPSNCRGDAPSPTTMKGIQNAG